MLDERSDKVGRSPATRCAIGMLILAAAGGCAGTGRVLDRMPQPIRMARSSPAPFRRVTPVQAPSSRPQPALVPAAATGWRPPKGIERSKWNYIVVHHSATATGGASAFDRFHREVNKWDELGYHFVIGNGTDTRDGAIEVGSRWVKQKWGAHCKVPGNRFNEHGIGICLVGNFEQNRPSAAQMDSLSRLVTFLMTECGIPTDQVLAHGSVTGHTACPGRYFPMARFQRELGHQLSSAASMRAGRG